MSINRSEERALEVMRQELATQRMPDLPWNNMERELMARLDEAPMTSQPRSLDARVDDVPVLSMRNPRAQFVRVGFVAFAMAAGFALFWMSPLNSGKPFVISTASPSVASPGASFSPLEPASSELPDPKASAAVQPSASAAPEAHLRRLTSAEVRKTFSKCVTRDKRYGSAGAPKLKGEQLVVFLETDGRIATIRFDSPLEPTVMECVFDALRSGRFVGKKSPVIIKF